MKKNIFFIFSLLFLGISVWGFFTFSTGVGFKEYIKESEYRRMHPEFLPSPIIVKAFDLGHSTSYASLLWMEFIQYLSDNLQDDNYLTFSHVILQQITDLHPYFIRPYEINLILTPFGNAENTILEKKIKNQTYTEKTILLGKKGMGLLCNKEKLEAIKKRSITENLVDDEATKNPCPSGILPYYMGFIIKQMGSNKIEASEYYKIASAQKGAPGASRILGILALSSQGDHLASALNFGLIGANGYDNDPYFCRSVSEKIIHDIGSHRPLDNVWIRELEESEKNLKDTRDQKNPLANTNDNCYAMTQKSIKEIYLGYITQLAKGTPYKTGEELIKAKIITKIPTISSQKNYTVYFKDEIWQYQQKIQ